MALSEEERFWGKVEKSEGCWLWKGSTIIRYGYGQFSAKRDGRWTMLRAHRVAYEFSKGAIPDGLKVLHDCDNPPCVRPDHLYLGTQAQNLEEMRRKGRASPPPDLSGHRHPLSKLNVEQVQLARELYLNGVFIADIARQFHVSRNVAARVVKGVSYR